MSPSWGGALKGKEAVIQIDGMVPVLVTPFEADESIRHEDIRRQVEMAVRFGASAVCLPAYGSEFYKMTDEERLSVVRTAVAASNGRIPVAAQSNHPSARIAAELARRNADAGADLISVACPRLFALSEDDLLRYCERVGHATPLPLLVQDFNPGGPTVGPHFARRLLEACPNFRFLKLEEPLMAAKVRAIRAATNDHVGVLEGWGGMYLMELASAGICGVMPGLGPADLLQRIWHLRQNEQTQEALDLFSGVLPLLVFYLQNMELYHHIEKRLLQARGILTTTIVREATVALDGDSEQYAQALIEHFLRTLDRAGLPRRPLAA